MATGSKHQSSPQILAYSCTTTAMWTNVTKIVYSPLCYFISLFERSFTQISIVKTMRCRLQMSSQQQSTIEERYSQRLKFDLATSQFATIDLFAGQINEGCLAGTSNCPCKWRESLGSLRLPRELYSCTQFKLPGVDYSRDAC